MEFIHSRSIWIRFVQAGALAGMLVAIGANAQDKPATESSAPAVSAPIGSAPVAIEPNPDAVVARYPSGSIQSVDTANKALQDVDAQRSALDKKYAAEQHDCYQKFFATSCLDAAKEKHRVGTEKMRKVEVEANAFIRSDRVVQRDKNLAEKRANESANPPKPLADLPIKSTSQNDEAQRAKDQQQRIADHDAKLKQLQQDRANDASKRAANVEAYNKKIQDAQARQADVEKKKAEKAKQAAAKSAASSSADTATSKIGVVPGASAPDASSPASRPKP